MATNRSLKLELWTKKDVALNVITYFLNVVILIAMFIAKVAIESAEQGLSLASYFKDASDFVNFVIFI